jgi:hypothetical protein
MSAKVDGYDYVAHRQVSMTRAEWAEKYPPAIYQRRVEDGETFYSRPGDRIAAEAYANIPAVQS